MDLRQQLADDLRQAARDKDAVRVSAIRMLRAAIQTLEIARTDPKDPKHGEPVTEQDLVVAIQKEVNQRKEALEFARKAGREDLIAKEEQTLAIMQGYLPRALTREEIAAEVEELIAELGPEFRRVMPAASARMRGRADGKAVAEIVRELTEGGGAPRG
jgi:uncharacterized protein YqeY